jgi:hypothetical protein
MGQQRLVSVQTKFSALEFFLPMGLHVIEHILAVVQKSVQTNHEQTPYGIVHCRAIYPATNLSSAFHLRRIFLLHEYA